MKKGTLGWRIFDLKKKNLIKAIGRSDYTISDKPEFCPEISKEAQKIAKEISQQFEDVQYCIWETNWLNEFSQHQSSQNMIIVEIEKDLVDSLFFRLKDKFKYNFFIELCKL